MKLLGFLKNGKGTVHEAGALSPATGSIDIIKRLNNGVTVVEIRLKSRAVSKEGINPFKYSGGQPPAPPM